jgi:hypothetical protein
MEINVNNPVISTEGKITADIFCKELNAYSKVEIDFSDLLAFASSASYNNSVDLFLISSFVYGVDRFIDRHTYSTDGWSRELRVTFPVYNLQSWNSSATSLEKLLSFLTGDYWQVSFSLNSLQFDSVSMPINYNKPFSQVNLFSGGLDSLIGAIDFLKTNPTKKLLLVSHFDPNMSARQEQIRLRDKLSLQYPAGFDFIPSVSVGLHFSQVEKEKTFRSRSFLFIGIAVLIANHQSLPIIVPENGTVSLNYPLSASRRSACSTRTTHPTFLTYVRNLLNQLGLSDKVDNCYEFKTKGEMVRKCKDPDLLKAIVGLSHSCGKSGHTANWTYKDKNHCGVCMPCIYRQAALQDFNDPTGYGNEINKQYTGRIRNTPFLMSKQGQDFNACLDFLRKDLKLEEIRNELLINGVLDLDKLDKYVKLIERSRTELKDWIKKAGNAHIKNKAGLS